MNRREFLQRCTGLGTTVIGAAILAACGGGTTAPASATSTSPSLAAPSAAAKPPAVSASAAPAGGSAPAASSAASPPAKPGLKKITYGNIHGLGDASAFIALDQGFFAEQGIDLQLVDFATAVDMIPVLGNGQLDTGNGITSAGLWNAVGRGVPIKIPMGTGASDVATHATVSTFMVRKALVDSGRVKSPADIKGLNVMTPPPGNGVELLFSLIFKKYGLTKSDVVGVPLAITEVAPALINGKLDVAATTEPSTTIISSQGAGSVLLHDYDIYPNYQAGALYFSPNMVKSDLAIPYMRAFLKGARTYNDAFFKKLPDARAIAVKALIAHTPLKDASLYDKMSFQHVDPSGGINVQCLQDMQDFFVAAGEQQKAVDLNSVIDLSFVKAAAAKLPPYS